MSVSVSGQGAQIRVAPETEGIDVPGLSPVRELRAIEGLPHSEKTMQRSSVARHGLFGNLPEGRTAVQAEAAMSCCLSVVGSPARRELGQKQLASLGCRMFLAAGWWVRVAALSTTTGGT